LQSNASARHIGNAINTIGGNISFGANGMGALNFTNTTAVALAASSATTRTFTVNSDTTFANGFTGTGSNANAASGIIKSGTAAMVMTGTSTYTGATTVNAGSLAVSASGVLGNTAVTVAAGAGLRVDGNIGGSVTSAGLVNGDGRIAGALTINSGGTLTAGGSATVGTITTGALTLNSGVLDVEFGRNGAVVTADRVNATGLVSLTGADLHLALADGLTLPVGGDVVFLIDNQAANDISGFFTKLNGVDTTLTEGSTFTWNSQQWEITYKADASTLSTTGGNDLALIAVPEPGTWAMLLSGVGLLVGVQRVRRTRNDS
jgi:autotransporter-associated beta strand protein